MRAAELHADARSPSISAPGRASAPQSSRDERSSTSYAGPTYYGQPAVKPSKFGGAVALYTFIAGVAGAAQVIAAVAGLGRDRRFDRVRRFAPRLGALSAGAGAALLAGDLGTPRRFYNMLRIFRPTSAMSIGSYVLTAFGATSALVALADLIAPREQRGLPVRPAEWAAAVSGAGMATYTASFLAATNTPLWAAAPRLLGAEFACGSMASGASALALLVPEAQRPLDAVAAVSTLARGPVVLAAAAERKCEGLDGGFSETRWGKVHLLGLALAIDVPLACFGLNLAFGASRTRSNVAALGILAGTFLSRWALFEAGNASAKRPEDYFRFTAGGRRP